MTSSSVFSCCFRHSKQSTYRAFNALFGRVGRSTSAGVIVQLFKMKCLPVLYYDCEVCPLNKTEIRSLQHVVKSCFSKFFQTRSDDIIARCMDMFNCLPVADAIARRRSNFVLKFSTSDNSLCQICCSVAPIVS